MFERRNLRELKVGEIVYYWHSYYENRVEKGVITDSREVKKDQETFTEYYVSPFSTKNRAFFRRKDLYAAEDEVYALIHNVLNYFELKFRELSDHKLRILDFLIGAGRNTA